MNDDIRALTALCPPPEDPIALGSCDAGSPEVVVPSVHRELNRLYGVGCFDEFLWIYGCGAANRNLDIGDRSREMQRILGSKEAGALRARLEPYGVNPEDLVQWGTTDNGDALMWIPAGDPEQWDSIFVSAGQLFFATSSKSSAGVLLDLLTGTLRLNFFPEDFPSEAPEFSENPYA
ncbi:hypothetical protein [Streptomyces venezuelae]|uniref:SMI1/KNR4 family protein n=1 Tax=Streptomyces venezuelae TaxID=54571 RepID=A0A5P2BU99_STRVZ|nr:hypothetical protein [Streptomyces venezuelae]QES34024.1 hypothetical protein DEJ48_12025 [Streptomyces venezuelae]